MDEEARQARKAMDRFGRTLGFSTLIQVVYWDVAKSQILG
jgi:hypothetical protein